MESDVNNKRAPAAGRRVRYRRRLGSLLRQSPPPELNCEHLHVEADRLLHAEIGFIYNESFDSLTYAQVDSGDRPEVVYSGLPRQSKSTEGLPAILSGLYTVPLLTFEGEQTLFRKLNYLKYWANALRNVIDLENVDYALVRDILTIHAEVERTRTRLVKSNLRLVVSIARRFSNSASDFDELVSEGSFILLNTVDKFDYARGFRFSTYATHSIQRHFYRRWKQSQRRRQIVLESPQELLEEMAQPEESEATNRDAIRATIRLLDRAKDHLESREHTIVTERFGLGPSRQPKTLRQVAEKLGLSKERVRQLQIQAMEKLRELAADRDSFVLGT